jgi:MHS family proline/betaine transporter-like MFS transporter
MSTEHRNLQEEATSDTWKQHDLKTTIAGVAGNVLEWYDFCVYGYFSDIIGKVFFPPNQKGNAALVESFAVFGIAFLVRPIGGAVFGHMGDNVGRKSALQNSILLMALPTFAMGCLPSFESVGWWSTALLIICRAFQGFSVGGQLMSSVVFTLEGTDQSKWGIRAAMVFAATTLGAVLGSLVAYVLRESLTDAQLESYGWRLPFFFGLLGIIPGLYLKVCDRYL